MKHRDFTTKQSAEEFKAKVERLGWTCSYVDYHPSYGYYVITNYPL